MPVIASFDGITVRMFFNDHPPPHFHVQYGGDRAIITIADGEMLAGALPVAVQRRIVEWGRTNQAALLTVWERARLGQPLGGI